MTGLPDGTYDAIVVDARDDDKGTMHLELAVSSGTRRGEVVAIAATGLLRSWVDVLGLPATIRVASGALSVIFD